LDKIGIYGGTFDPIHLGHLIIAQCFVEQFSLDKCFFVPAKISPFKTDQTTTFSDEERTMMIELSIQGNPLFSVETYELSTAEISYTINTVNYFKEKYPNSELYLLIGYDQAINFDKWKESAKIKEITKVVVARRIVNHKEYTDNFPNNFIALNNPIISISSTYLRKRILEKKTLQYLVVDEVWEYIKKNKYGK